MRKLTKDFDPEISEKLVSANAKPINFGLPAADKIIRSLFKILRRGNK